MRLFVGLIFLLVAAFMEVRAAQPEGEFPFQYREGLLWVQVRVGQSPKPLNFLLDSGANVSVLHLPTAQRLGLRLGQRVSVSGVQATTDGYWPQHLKAQAGEVKLPKDYLVMDLSDLGRACAIPVDGLIGADFFRQHLLQIDFAAEKVRLLNRAQRPSAREILPLETRRCGLRVPIRVNGHELQWFRLDTGCATALQWVTSSVDPKTCNPQMAVALTRLSIPATQVAVEVGSTRFECVPAGLHNQPIFAGECGLLGNGILSRFKVVTVDVKNRRLFLE